MTKKYKSKYGGYYGNSFYGNNYYGGWYGSEYGSGSYSSNYTSTYKTTSVAKKTLTPEQKEQLEKYKRANLERNFEVVNTYEEAVAKSKETGKGIYFFGKDGIYLYKVLKIGGNSMETVDKVDTCGLLGEVDVGLRGFQIVNKIPKELFIEVLGSFNKIYEKSGDEAAAQIYRKNDGSYFIYYPEQRICKASVSYPDDPKIPELRTQNELVLEMHSHNSMAAFWSGTDDANEQEPCMYIVCGTLNAESATYKARAKYKTYQVELKLSDVFDMTPEEEVEILKAANRSQGNDEILDKITNYKTPVVTNITGVQTSDTDPANPYAKNYFQEASTKAPTPIDATLLGVVNDYISSLALSFNYNNVPKTMAVKFLEASRASDLTNLKDANSKHLDGELLPPHDAPDYTENMEALIKAKMLAMYGICNYTVGGGLTYANNLNLFTTDGYKDAIKTFYDSEAFSYSYNLPIIWEALTFYEKATLANAFYCSVPELGAYMYEKEEANYYFVAFLYMYLFADEVRRNDLQKYIDSCTTYITCYTNDQEDYESYGDIAAFAQVMESAMEVQIDNVNTQPIATLSEIVNDYEFNMDPDGPSAVSPAEEDPDLPPTEEQLGLFTGTEKEEAV